MAEDNSTLPPKVAITMYLLFQKIDIQSLFQQLSNGRGQVLSIFLYRNPFHLRSFSPRFVPQDHKIKGDKHYIFKTQHPVESKRNDFYFKG